MASWADRKASFENAGRAKFVHRVTMKAPAKMVAHPPACLASVTTAMLAALGMASRRVAAKQKIKHRRSETVPAKAAIILIETRRNSRRLHRGLHRRGIGTGAPRPFAQALLLPGGLSFHSLAIFTPARSCRDAGKRRP
jgi:hypothetical protein